MMIVLVVVTAMIVGDGSPETCSLSLSWVAQLAEIETGDASDNVWQPERWCRQEISR